MQRLADHGDAESRCDKGEGAGGPAWIPIGAAWKPDALSAPVAFKFVEVLARMRLKNRLNKRT